MGAEHSLGLAMPQLRAIPAVGAGIGMLDQEIPDTSLVGKKALGL